MLTVIKNIVPKRIKNIIKLMLPKKILNNFVRTTYIIDVVGSCNLSCPSCPSGDYVKKNPSGMMKKELFEKIIHRIAKDDPGATVSLYNWTEPMLHTKIDEFIIVVKNAGLKATLSTNLNLLRDADLIAKANPDGITVSLSGFTNDVYRVGHKGGDIELVKKNMIKLSDSLKKFKSSTDISVYYHKYFHNLHETDLMKKFSESLGFSFGDGWAYYMPIERVLDYQYEKLPSKDVEFIKEHIVFDINQFISKCSSINNYDCSLQENIITMNFKGEVQLCCAVYDYEKFKLGNYLDMDKKEIFNKMKIHGFCKQCKANSLHTYCTWHNFEELHLEMENLTSAAIQNRASANV